MRRQPDEPRVVDGRMPQDLVDGCLGRDVVQVQYAHRLAAGRIPQPSYGHLGNIDPVPSESIPNGADDAGHVVVAEHQEVAVQVRLHAVFAQADQPGHVVAENRTVGPVGLVGAVYLRADGRGKKPTRAPRLFRQVDPAFAEQHLTVDDVDFFVQRVFEQSRAEGGGEQARVLIDHLPPVGKAARARPSAVPLGKQDAQPVGHVEISAQRLERVRIDGDRVDRVADFARHQETDQQVDGFHGDAGLRLFRAGAEMGRTQHARHVEQRTVHAGFFLVDVQRHAGQLPGLQTPDQRFLVVNAPSGAVDQARAGFEQVDFFVAHQVMRLRREGGMHGQVIHLRQQVAQIVYVFHTQLGGLFG